MSHGDLLVPLLDAREQGVVELLVDLKNVLDFVEDGVDLLDGEDGLRGRGRGFQGAHRLDGQKNVGQGPLMKSGFTIIHIQSRHG